MSAVLGEVRPADLGQQIGNEPNAPSAPRLSYKRGPTGQQNGTVQALISLGPVFVPKLTLCETRVGAATRGRGSRSLFVSNPMRRGNIISHMTRSGWIAYSALTLMFLGFAAFSEYRQHTLQKAIDNVAWDARLADHLQTDNFITASVGSIQFIKHGRYSIEIEDLKYTGNGLECRGSSEMRHPSS